MVTEVTAEETEIVPNSRPPKAITYALEGAAILSIVSMLLWGMSELRMTPTGLSWISISVAAFIAALFAKERSK